MPTYSPTWVLQLMTLDIPAHGQLLELVTDHSSCRWLLSQDDLTGIRQRWSVVLSQFNMIEIAHISIEDNVVADALSRYPQEGGSYYEHLVDQEGIVDLDHS